MSVTDASWNMTPHETSFSCCCMQKITFLEPTQKKRKIIHQSGEKGLHRQIVVCGNTNAALQEPCELPNKDTALPNQGKPMF